MKTHKAKRIDTGVYHYRGYEIGDTGNGRSVADAMNRTSGRWRIDLIRWRPDGTYMTLRAGMRSFSTLAAAKAYIDALADKAEVAT